jgi:hypothetical protein
MITSKQYAEWRRVVTIMRLGEYEQEAIKKQKKKVFVDKAIVAITSFVLGYFAALVIASLMK